MQLTVRMLDFYGKASHKNIVLNLVALLFCNEANSFGQMLKNRRPMFEAESQQKNQCNSGTNGVPKGPNLHGQ